MTQSNDAVADQTKQATAQTEQGRADGAPELLHFDETETDLNALKWIDAPGILVFWVLAVVVFLQFFTRYVLNDSLA